LSIDSVIPSAARNPSSIVSALMQEKEERFVAAPGMTEFLNGSAAARSI
jgi:hypothetical protein